MAIDNEPTLVRFDRVGKRYARRRHRGSLRDSIPALAGRLIRRPNTADEHAARESWVLRDVSFTVRHGEALGIIGHNGAGKSTILKLLAGVTAPTRGRTQVTGRLAALIELGAGFHPDLTGRENVYLNGSILGLTRAEIHRKLESIVDFANLEKFIDMQVKYYSTGMYARLGFSVAAHVEPEILLIDEVLSVGDYAFQQKCMRRMEEFRRSGVAIVFVSHNLSAISNLCSKAILLQAGHVVAEGAPMDVIGSYTNMSYAVVAESDATRVSEMEQGWITRHMEILGVAVHDLHDRPANSFRGGEMTTLTIRARANRDVHEPVIVMSLRNAEATIVYTTSSAALKASIGDVATGEEIEASFPLTLHLCEGMYTVYASVLAAQGGEVMDWRENVATLQIAGDQTSSGIADLRASVRIHRCG